MNLYNEIDPYAAQWTRNLAAAGHIAAGTVDERSIKDLRAEDVREATQAHFFAGIGVWSYALKLAGWPDSRPVWTGSCPCQPFSSAGRQAGFSDERHLWPAWFELIRECRPPVVLGEQVASAGAWLDLVQADLEGIGYAFGAAVLTAAGVGAPHIRARLYFVAYASSERRDGLDSLLLGGRPQQDSSQASGGGEARLVVDTMHAGRPERRPSAGAGSTAGSSSAGELEHAAREQMGLSRLTRQPRSAAGELGDTSGSGLEGCANEDPRGAGRQDGRRAVIAPSRSFWADAEWIACRDRKNRPVEPGTFPLAHGITGRVGRLRAYGNALCAPQAASFIRSVMGAPRIAGVG